MTKTTWREPAVGAYQRAPQLRQLAVAADERVECGFASLVARHQAIAAPSDGFEYRRLQRILAERGANLANADAQHRLADGGIRPTCAKELLFGDEPSALPDQLAQHPNDLERKGRSVSPRHRRSVVVVQAEGPRIAIVHARFRSSRKASDGRFP